MGKVHIGVTAVGGHKLWGGGRQEGCGIRCLGEWVSGGRLTAGGGEVAGRACPAPTGWRKGERVLAGNGQAEGSRPLPTMWKVRGWLWESARAGHARPLRGVMVEGTVCFPHSAHVNVENTCNFYLIIIV